MYNKKMLPKLELVMSTYKQSSCHGYLIVLLSVSFALIGCSQAANTRIASAGPVTTWIQQNAIPLKTVEPGGSDADLQPLQSRVGNASIVGLGEETDGTHTTKIHFIGMDCQEVSQGDFDEVENYVHAVDPQQAAHIQNLYADIIARGIAGRYTIYPHLSAETKQQYQDEAQRVYNLLNAHQQAYENRSSLQTFALALQNARIIVQFTTYANQNSQDESLARYIQRDAFMAENVAWIHDHAAGSHPS